MDTPDLTIGEEAFKAEAYSFLQLVIGGIAVALPPIVYLGDRIIDGQRLRGSISSYYYGRTGGWFVGSLCAMAVFFFSYEYRPRQGRHADKWLSNFAAIAAIGVALFPTASDCPAAKGGARAVSIVHLSCAAVLFGLLADFSLWQFTKTADEDSIPRGAGWKGRWRLIRESWMRIFRDPKSLRNPTAAVGRQKKLQRTIHRICGWTIVGALIAIVVNNSVDLGLLFWGEALAVEAFGVSWLVKSHGLPIFQDDDTKARKRGRKAMKATERSARLAAAAALD